MPSVPPAQIAPAAKRLGTPRARISGIPDRPMAAAVAGLEPQIATTSSPAVTAEMAWPWPPLRVATWPISSSAMAPGQNSAHTPNH